MNGNLALENGKKYLREVTDQFGNTANIDVYDVLTCFEVENPAVAHAIKKLLCAGKRGKASKVADLEGARVAIVRALQLEGAEHLRE